ncbi:uncharacterized acetyltransferase At3g50280-like [Humulus lupulus]|uniref:uncharacterized acetyltransferase At3g50280-like n=1 Tax=Humulus lupulus TaxID=3486 RepID=UPI002B40B0A1|nr:uncharacterized acetyltransferase At3g50280-like [Humulus lupulus]
MESKGSISTRRISRVELTQSDLILIQHNYIQKGLLLPKPDHHQAQPFSNQWIQRLRTTFSKALEIFYPLTGRLVMIQNDDVRLTTSFFLDCNGAGASFDHVTSDGVLTVADVLDPVYIPDDVVYSFFPMNKVSNYQGVSKPLLAARVTELVDGVFVALSMNHCVGDGTTFWLFFNTWSRISRDNGVDLDPIRLVFDRDQFFDGIINRATDLPFRVPFNPDRVALPSVNKPVLSLKQMMFRFSKETIAKLKAKVNAQMVDYSPTMTTKISSLQAVMAHLWVSITRNRNLKPEQEVSYFITVGLRQRAEPPLPEGYFGNAIMAACAKTTVGKLVGKNGLGWAALQMNTEVASQTWEKAQEYLKKWAESPKLVPQENDEIWSHLLVTGSSPRFDVYGNDFGWGKPVAVRSGPGNKSEGKLTVYAGTEDGGFEFEACLRSETFEAMKDDEEFMETLTM